MDGHIAAATLGVSPQATKSDIRRAFRALAKRAHPDARSHGSDEAFIALRTAYETLVATAPDRAPAPTGPPARSTGTDTSTGTGTGTAPDTGTGTSGGPWSQAIGRRPVIDLLDCARRAVTPPASSDTGRRVPPARAAAHAAPRVDRRGMTFGDHLDAALAAAG